MASTYFHRTRLRRRERQEAVGHGSINLVPLVDILTSIVFFSLLTYAGTALAALTSFDLTLPPTVIDKPEDAAKIKSEKDLLNLLLTVRVDDDGILVEHSGDGGYKKRVDGISDTNLDQFQTEMVGIREKYPQNHDVLVIPADGMNYENIVHVLERLKRARFSGIALGTRARRTPVTVP